MKRSIPGLIMIASLMLSVSCGNATTTSPNGQTPETLPAPPPSVPQATFELNGSQWKAVSINGSAVINGSSVTLNFSADGSASGKSGANSYGGNFTANMPDIQFSQIMMTLLLGPDKRINEQEQVYLSCLGRAASYRIEDGRLLIFDSGGRQLLVFERTS